MAWNVEYTDEFGSWWLTLSDGEREDVDTVVGLLERYGVRLGHPYSSDIKGSRHRKMRELRVQSGGKPIRIFYAFDPRRTAILLIGGSKAGVKRFYEIMLPAAERLYDIYLDELRKEGLIE
jgi:hypothetical protein